MLIVYNLFPNMCLLAEVTFTYSPSFPPCWGTPTCKFFSLHSRGSCAKSSLQYEWFCFSSKNNMVSHRIHSMKPGAGLFIRHLVKLSALLSTAMKPFRSYVCFRLPSPCPASPSFSSDSPCPCPSTSPWELSKKQSFCIFLRIYIYDTLTWPQYGFKVSTIIC